LKSIRTIGAHGYRNTGASMSFLEQIQDSNTVAGHSPLTVLLFPVGLRYHCLHHLFPGLPYHSMGIAHRRLMAQLPADFPYRSMARVSGSSDSGCGEAPVRLSDRPTEEI
jgi:Fatty acid desaturase